MKSTPPDPFSKEERELATRLARVAPHGVPSPEIDARILSASRAAVPGARARPVRPRWPMAMGVAASMVLAVGVAWQLRPTPPAAIGPGLAPAEPAPFADLAAEPPAPVVRVQPAPSTVAAGEPVTESLPEVARDSTAAPSAARALPPSAAPRPVVPAPEAEPAEAAMPTPVVAPPPPPPPPPTPAAPAARTPTAAAPPVLPADSTQAKSSGATAAQRQEETHQAEASSAREAENAAEAATASRRELRVAPVSERVQEDASPGDGGPVRVRRTDLQVPVAADAQLQVDDWLERVRTRYGLGDEEAARRSLMLFVQDHPTEPVPGDLEPLLDE